MNGLRIVALLTLLTSSAIAQDLSRQDVPQQYTQDQSSQSRDLFTTIRAYDSLAMFVSAIQSSGMVKMLREEGPFTVFALSNRAFANLPKKDMEALLSNRAAMNILLAHYIVRGSISENPAELESARTLLGVKLRTDIRSEGIYINGAKFEGERTSCSNGAIYVLDRFDPAFVHDALTQIKSTKN
jgi:uncharacterized surface protein with fasciclin (FAS1) repeats